MDINKILSIGGRPGLWEMKAQTRGGVLAESLIDGKKIPVNVKNNISMLGEISIYTYAEEVPLREIFQKIGEKENFGKAIDHKSSKTDLIEYFRATKSNHPQRRDRPVVAPNSFPTLPIVSPSSSKSSVGKGPLPTRVV